MIDFDDFEVEDIIKYLTLEERNEYLELEARIKKLEFKNRIKQFDKLYFKAFEFKIRINQFNELFTETAFYIIHKGLCKDGRLHYAVRHYRIDLIIAFLMSGDNIEEINKNGKTPLAVACCELAPYGYFDKQIASEIVFRCIDILLKYGADVHFEINNSTPTKITIIEQMFILHHNMIDYHSVKIYQLMFDYGALVTKFMIETNKSYSFTRIHNLILEQYEYQRNPGFKR